MDNVAVRIDSVTKKFNNIIALNQISANIKSGIITGIVGPDGAGKTTLIRLIASIMQQEIGVINVHGYDNIKEASNIHNIIGYMPQKFGLYEDLSVIENLELYAGLKSISGLDKKEIFAHMLSFTGLNKFQARMARDLSGGMKQKLGLACALLSRPKILLLDEPTVGVDPLSRLELWQMVKDLATDGISTIWSTSYLDEAEKCDEVILLNEGNILFQGKPQNLTKIVQNRTYILPSPNNKREILTKLITDENIIDGVIQGDDIRFVLMNGASINYLKLDAILTKPRFEDAFIDILGGIKHRVSNIADQLSVKNNTGYAIEAVGLTKKFGDFIATDNISFNVERGKIFGLLGPNGAGKSTSFKMLCGLLKPTSGNSKISGIDLQKSTSVARSKIGYMAQKFSLYSDLSVIQNLNFFAGIYGLQGIEKKNKIEQMIQEFDMDNILAKNAGTLPLGFKQRLALACAIMHDPDILFLDEPTSGVDPITRREFWMNINAMVAKNVTIMVTTHFMDEAEYCDEILLIYKGKNIAQDSPDNLKLRVKNKLLPNPTLEQAFIALIKEADKL
jgi:ABC-2 type transport system ATP-binding protein